MSSSSIYNHLSSRTIEKIQFSSSYSQSSCYPCKTNNTILPSNKNNGCGYVKFSTYNKSSSGVFSQGYTSVPNTTSEFNSLDQCFH